MVKISDGKNVYKVSKGAFESMYKNQGYVIIEEAGIKVAVVEAEEVKDVIDEVDAVAEVEPDAVDEVVEKSATSIDEVEQLKMIPVSEMNAEQVKKLAEALGVDVTVATSLKEAKRILKASM